MRRGLMVLLAGVLLTLPAVPALAGTAGVTGGERMRDLAQARAATAKYHDVDVAIADGYLPTEHCFEAPGLGTMGMHYMHPAYAFDAVIDPLKPEVLLYVPTEDGVELVAVEYYITAADVTQTPTIFGQPFDGPMAGHEPGHPEHYDLHVWLWAHNPNGMFAQFNPNLTCGA